MSENIVKIIFQGQSGQLDKKLKDVGAKLGNFSKKASKLGKELSTKLSLPLLAAGGAAIKFASDFNESLNKVDVAFGSSQKHVKDFAKTALQQFGIAEGSALDMAALFGDMATSMGFAQDSAAGMSTELVGLAGDLASFKNIDIEQATTALAGVFTGETESLKRLGIVMTEVNLQQFAMEKGLTTNIKKMTQSEKVALRYEYIMSKTANAQGDFARTGGGAANQMRIFQESLKQLAANFGQILLPAFTKILIKINAFILQLDDISPKAKKFIAVIGGLGIVLPPIAAVLPSISKGFALMGGALKFMTGPIGIVVAAVTALTIGLPKLDKALGVQTSTWTKIKNLFKSGGNMAQYAANQVKDGTPIIDDNKESVDELTKSYDDFALSIQKILNPVQKVGERVKAISVNAIESVGSFAKMGEAGDIVGTTLTESLTPPLKMVTQFGNAMTFLGEEMMFAFASAFESMLNGQSFIKTLGQAILGLIKKLVAAAAAALVLSTLLGGIGVGKIGKTVTSFKGIFGAITGFAKGGIVSTPTLGLMGEYPGARSNPEVIAPLDKLQGMLANTGGGGKVEVGGQFVLKGQDLVVALQRANRNRDRIN